MVTIFLRILTTLDILESVTNAAADDDGASAERSILATTRRALSVSLDNLRSRCLFRFEFIAFVCF